jgi:hypothetical protein
MALDWLKGRANHEGERRERKSSVVVEVRMGHTRPNRPAHRNIMDVWKDKLYDLEDDPIDHQASVFQKRFVFSLGDKFGEVMDIKRKFLDALATDPGRVLDTMSPATSATFMKGLDWQMDQADLKLLDNEGRLSMIQVSDVIRCRILPECGSS